MKINVFFIIVLTSLVVGYVLNLVANLLNLKALKLDLPPLLEGVYKLEDYRNSQRYTRAVTHLDFVVSTVSLLLLLSFWFSGGFGYLDQTIRSWGLFTIVNGLLYIGILLLAYSLLMLPFSIYATFVIEERFGFNRSTRRTFFVDNVKGLALAVLIGTPLLAGILSLFDYAGAYAWLYCWLTVTLFSLVIEFVAPTWIMPLFNKFTPMEPGELKEAILKYAGSVNFPIKNISVMDGSRRSSKSNAFFTGFGHTKRIALFDTLIQKHTTPELVAVLAHEIGHYKKKHVRQGMIISILHMGLILFLLSVFVSNPGLYEAFHIQQPSIYTGLILFGLLYTPIELLLSIAMQMVSRKNEYEADHFAADTIEERQNLIDALKKLSATNFSNLTPHPFYVFLNYSHPPLLQRVIAIQKGERKT